jgi:hypothetical protein
VCAAEFETTLGHLLEQRSTQPQLLTSEKDKEHQVLVLLVIFPVLSSWRCRRLLQGPKSEIVGVGSFRRARGGKSACASLELSDCMQAR